MILKRRSFLKGLAGAGAGLTVAPLFTGKAEAREAKMVQDSHIGMLYDATKCIGCKACETGCKQANDLPIELDSTGTYDAPRDLSINTFNIIKLYDGPEGRSFVKRQCMHCVDPSCVSGCPTSALNKEANGIVTYNKDACCGCRYCQMNCPFNIPKFQYNDWYGEIKKCELCRTTNLVTKGQPGCTEACPAGAVIFGKVKDLLVDARSRIQENPEIYANHIYGEKDGGGTSVLYLTKADVTYDKLGLPNLPEHSQASVSEGVQHTLYQGLILPGIVYVVLAGIAFKNRSGHKED